VDEPVEPVQGEKEREREREREGKLKLIPDKFSSVPPRPAEFGPLRIWRPAGAEGLSRIIVIPATQTRQQPPQPAERKHVGRVGAKKLS
jgi:hypothetical protein